MDLRGSEWHIDPSVTASVRRIADAIQRMHLPGADARRSGDSSSLTTRYAIETLSSRQPHSTRRSPSKSSDQTGSRLADEMAFVHTNRFVEAVDAPDIERMKLRSFVRTPLLLRSSTATSLC